MRKEDQPLVSIITPCYNVEKYIKEYLYSVLAQTYDNIELILIDDGSTDKTKDIIELYKKKIKRRGYKFKYIYQENSGQAVAVNKGLSIFTGKYFTWPDSDDILSRNNIESKVLYFKNNFRYGMVRGKRKFFERDMNKFYELDDNANFKNEEIFFDLFLEKTFPSGGCYLLKRDLFLECYPDLSIYEGLGSQNWQLLVPAASRSKCGNIDEVVYYVREHPKSFSRRKRSLDEWFMRFDDHKNLLFDAFLHSECDIEVCKAIVEEKYARRRFEYAFSFNNRDIAEKQYQNLKGLNKVKLNDTLKRLIVKNKYSYYTYVRLQKIKLQALHLQKEARNGFVKNLKS